jgi:hypothetical protein
MSALGTAVKYAYSQAKLQQRLEQEEMDRMRKWEKEHPEEPYPGPEAYEAFEREKKAGGTAGGAEGHTYETYDFENDPKWKVKRKRESLVLLDDFIINRSFNLCFFSGVRA